jgi:hypothetical protein
MASQDGERTINLFGKNNTSELMRQRDATQGEQ